MGSRGSSVLEDVLMEDEDMVDVEMISDPRFNMGMTKFEKIEARRPWRNGLIIKFIGRKIRYHYLSWRIQVM